MKNASLKTLPSIFALLGFCVSTQPLQAQYFNGPQNGDLIAGFRKTGAFQGTNELVGYIGNVTNFLAVTAGSSVTVTNVIAARLTDSFSTDYTHLQWSVFGANLDIQNPWSTSYGSFPSATLWFTVPRTTVSVQSMVPPRYYKTFQNEVVTVMTSITGGANSISRSLGTTNVDNNVSLVREPVQGNSSYILTAFMGDPSDPTFGDFNDAAFSDYTVENITPAPFTAAVRSDLYEIAPRAFNGTVYVDPITGSTNSVYWVGYFDLSPSGTLTFTRASVTVTPPPAPFLSIARTGNISKISFLSTNTATYTLFYNNTAGLRSATSNWPSLPGTMSGNNGIISFQDTTTDSNRVYRVGAH
jgi:hypothetical protein